MKRDHYTGSNRGNSNIEGPVWSWPDVYRDPRLRDERSHPIEGESVTRRTRAHTFVTVALSATESVDLVVVENRVAMVRESRGAPISELAHLTGITAIRLRAIENGIVVVEPKEKLVISLVLGASLPFLFPVELPDDYGVTY